MDIVLGAGPIVLQRSAHLRGPIVLRGVLQIYAANPALLK